MLQTTNYKLTKLQLDDTPVNIEDFNENWDTIDTNLKKLSDEKFNKAGGTIGGKTTVSAGGVDVTGDSTFNNNLTIKGTTVHENPIRSTKAEFLQTQAPVVKGTAPSSTIFNYWSVFDQNGWDVTNNRLAHIDYSVGTDKTATLSFFVNKYIAGSGETGCGFYARWANGEIPQIAMSHHPADNSNDYSIPSTYWVRNRINEAVNSNKTQLVRW